MKNFVYISIFAASALLASHAYSFGKDERAGNAALLGTVAQVEKPTGDSKFKCDGREYCSQMTSCEEARYFVKNCPNTKMDGDHDGIPCEGQWCK